MTRKELVDAFVTSKDVDGKPFNLDRVDPILPFLLGDLMLSEYTLACRGANFRHQLHQLGTRWIKTYTSFNHGFFSHYPQDAWDDIIELMDSLSEALEPDLVELRSRIALIMEGVEGEDADRIVHLLTVYVLAQYAQVCWGQVYKVGVQRGMVTPHKNLEIAKMKELSFKMAVEYFRSLSTGSVSLSSINTDGIFDRIAKHLREWVQNN